MNTSHHADRTVGLAAVWCVAPFLALFGIGFVAVAGFIPPPSPHDSARELTDVYLRDLDQIRIGMVISMVGVAFFGPWGVSIVATSRRAETGRPYLVYTQVVCVAAGLLLAVGAMVLFSLAAFRPGVVSPDVTQTLNDAGWFVFLFTWPPFTAWCFALAALTFLDRSENPVFPRWAAYFNLWCGLLYLPAALLLFFKTGPFAYDGVFALYVPVTAFFAWIIVMSVLTISAIKRGDSG